MSLLQFAGRLGSMLSDLAEPLFGQPGPPPQKQVDRAMKHVDAAMDKEPPPQPGAPAAEAVGVALAVPTAQVKQVLAEPPMAWEGGAWRCDAPTTVTLAYADGTRERHACEAGAVIRVAAGLMHFPLPRT